MKAFVSRILEEVERNDYPEFRYMMFFLPVLLKARTIVETGLGLGHSTRIFLEACRYLGDCHLYTYEINLHHPVTISACKSVKELGLSDWWTAREMDSIQGGKEWSDGEIDILYLDSDHSFKQVYNELIVWTPHVKARGVIFAHDSFPGNPNNRPSTVLLAFEKFAEERNYRVINFETPEGMCFLDRNHSVFEDFRGRAPSKLYRWGENERLQTCDCCSRKHRLQQNNGC